MGVVLVAVPDAQRAATIARALAAERLMPVTAYTFEAMLAFAAEGRFAAVVVDAAIDPAVDPRVVIRTLAEATPVPMVVLGFVPGDGSAALAPGTAGLLGADAPAADVVGTVVTAIAHDGRGGDVVSCADLVVDLRNYEAWSDGRSLDLTPTELRLLAALVAGQGGLVTKQQLQTAAWGSASPHDDNRLQAHIRRLRRKLDRAHGPGGCRVRTVRGVGFRLEKDAEAGALVHPFTS